jgi:hypothetical protein
MQKRQLKVLAGVALGTNVAAIALRLGLRAIGPGGQGIPDIIFNTCDSWYFFLVVLLNLAYVTSVLVCLRRHEDPDEENKCIARSLELWLYGLAALGVSYLLCVLASWGFA